MKEAASLRQKRIRECTEKGMNKTKTIPMRIPQHTGPVKDHQVICRAQCAQHWLTCIKGTCFCGIRQQWQAEWVSSATIPDQVVEGLAQRQGRDIGQRAKEEGKRWWCGVQGRCYKRLTCQVVGESCVTWSGTRRSETERNPHITTRQKTLSRSWRTTSGRTIEWDELWQH